MLICLRCTACIMCCLTCIYHIITHVIHVSWYTVWSRKDKDSICFEMDVFGKEDKEEKKKKRFASWRNTVSRTVLTLFTSMVWHDVMCECNDVDVPMSHVLSTCCIYMLCYVRLNVLNKLYHFNATGRWRITWIWSSRRYVRAVCCWYDMYMYFVW